MKETRLSEVRQAGFQVFDRNTGESVAIFPGTFEGRILKAIAVIAYRLNFRNVASSPIHYGERYGVREGEDVFSYNYGVNDGALGSNFISPKDRLSVDPRVWMD